MADTGKDQKYYNEERKLAYISEKREEVVLSNNLESVFKLAAKREAELEKDICEWNSGEILEFYRYYTTPRLQSLIMVHNRLTAYADWCLVNGLIRDNQNHFREITRQQLINCLDLGALSGKVFTRKHLLEIVSFVPNNQDKFIFLGLFEGITMRNENLVKVKLSDFDGNKVRLSDGGVVNVSDELVQIAKMADADTEYVAMSVNRKMSFQYEPADEIIKIYIYGGRTVPNKASWVGNKIRKCCAFCGIPVLTVRDIVESGRIHYIINDMNANGITDINDYMRNIPLRSECERIFGKIQMYSGYIETYGKFFEVFK